MKRYKVRHCIQTCSACPSQWDIYTNEGDCVLDCTMGSGSTMVACVNTGRRGIGIELMQEYYDIAVKRVKDAQAQLKLDLTL